MSEENFKNIFKAVEKHRSLIFDTERYIWNNPETGYREWKTSAYLEAEFEKLGYKLKKAGNIPGFYTDVNTGLPGPRIIIFGELDSIICNEHPEADPDTGAVHSCGHNTQCAALLGIAAALKEEGLSEGLCGSVRLCAVPAEEGVDIEYRENLRKAGTINYYSGKVEYMYRGFLDDVDMALLVHAAILEKGFKITKDLIGNIKKRIVFKGIAAHAGGQPQDGINALYAANLGLNAINSLRETFVDNDHIRVHPIITKGGSSVNAIPSEVILETYVRGATAEAIYDANRKVNRALAGAAASMGAKVSISDRNGSLPLINDRNMIEVAKVVMEEITEPENIEISDTISTGCTDMGDVSAVIPALQVYTAGAIGRPHGSNYYIKDPEAACINSAKFQLAMLKLLLSNNAEKAKEIIDKKHIRYPYMEAYFEDVNRFIQDKDAVNYRDDGSIYLP